MAPRPVRYVEPFGAVVWTVSTFVGSQLARLQSWWSARLPLTRLLYAVGIIATVACAAIFT